MSAQTVTRLFFFLVLPRVDECHSRPRSLRGSPLPFPSAPALGGDSSGGTHRWSWGGFALEEGGVTAGKRGFSIPRGEGPTGSTQRSRRAGSLPGTRITQRTIPAQLCGVAGWGWIFLGWVLFFFSPLVWLWVCWFFFFSPFIVFCGGAGFLLSVSEVCSGDEKD